MNAASAWSDAAMAAQLFAVDPMGTGVLLRSRAGPVRERWLALMRAALPPSAPVRHLPLHIADGRLLGGLDLNATLLARRPAAERGLLSEADGGVLVVAMAERLPQATSIHLASGMDAKETIVERDGLSLRTAARFGTVALDEGLEDESPPESLRDRLAFWIDLNDIPLREADGLAADYEAVAAARGRLESVGTGNDLIEAICTAAAALGIVSLRAPLLCLRVARAGAALAGHSEIEQQDVALAARLVLAPRARVLPESLEPDAPAESPPDDPPSDNENSTESDPADLDRALDEIILTAVQAALPPDVLAALRTSTGRDQEPLAGQVGRVAKIECAWPSGRRVAWRSARRCETERDRDAARGCAVAAASPRDMATRAGSGRPQIKSARMISA